MTDKIHEAIIYADCRHAGDVRKQTSIPYLVHPMEVMGILIANDCSEDVVVAGILHDAIEDTCENNDVIRDIVRQEIKTKFGPAVLQIVDNKSEDKSKTWQEHKQHTVDSLATKDLETRLVCCAEKLSNIKSIASDQEKIGEKIWQRFNASKKDQQWYCTSVVKALHLDGYPMYEELKTVVTEVFNK